MKKKAAILLTAVFISSLGMTACDFKEKKVEITSQWKENEVFRIHNKSCSLEEARVFLTNYQNLYGQVYDINLWEHDFGENSLEQYVKDLTISQLARIISMNFLAEEQEVSLTQEEIQNVEQAAEIYYTSLSQDEITYMGVDQEDIVHLYHQYGLANKLYKHLTKEVNDEVSDDEARVMEALQIYVTDLEKAEEISTQLKEEADFMTLAGTYHELEQIEVTFGKGQLPEVVEEAAFNLGPDEISDMVKVEDGYYFIKCINHYNQELTDANKQVILEKRRKEAFEGVYHKFVSGLSSKLNETLWDSVEIETNPRIQTKCFFEIYQEYCKW